MKLDLSVQFICSILLTIAAIGMMVAAFVYDSVSIWKAFTIIFATFSILFIKQSYKELRQS